MHVGARRSREGAAGARRAARLLPALPGAPPPAPSVRASPPGYASSRAMLFQQLPTAGLPPEARATGASTSRWSTTSCTSGSSTRWDEIRWDIRPSPKWGTVEVRACDGLPTTLEVGALAALVQCLVDDFSERLDAGETAADAAALVHPGEQVACRPLRHGRDHHLNAAGDERLVEDDTRDLVAAARAGRGPPRLPHRAAGPRADRRHRRLLRAPGRGGGEGGGDLRAVVLPLISELRDGFRPPQPGALQQDEFRSAGRKGPFRPAEAISSC